VTRELSRIALRIKRLQTRHHRAIDAALAPLGISLVQWDALRHLHENPQASLHELAALTFQSDQAMGTLAQRMIDRGLLEREAGPGRAVRHRITARGEQLRVHAQDLVDDVLAESLRPLSAAELHQFDAILDKLVG
jgi:DNA-binding MarR family transcriptional regulator